MPIQPKQQPPYYKEGINTRQYIAYINQTGTSNPTANVLKNTLGQTITWTRASIGEYTGTAPGAFIAGFNKITCEPGGSGVQLAGIGYTLPFDYGYTIQRTGNDTVQLTFVKSSDYTPDKDLSEILADNQCLIKITIYE